jgi:trans-2,3-dihydro-3-hydroxyanthranilate isomerase
VAKDAAPSTIKDHHAKLPFLPDRCIYQQAFGGNPLAVFPNAEGLTAEDMLRLTREMNLSETTFVFPPTVPGADYKVRIFMTRGEIPFAGHPVVGTQWLLAHLGRTKLPEPGVRVNFELGVGVRGVSDYRFTSQTCQIFLH